MGVWDLMYLVQQYKKALRLAENQDFSEKTRSEFSLKAENLRLQIGRHLERAEKSSMIQESYNKDGSIQGCPIQIYLSVPLVSPLHPWDMACSAACVRSTRAIPGSIALVGSFSATCALRQLPVELHATRGMCVRVV